MVSAEQLKDRFFYKDGELIFKDGPRKGKSAGCILKGGYKTISPTIVGKRTKMLLHRAIYLMFHGELPELIDHIDRDPTNNRVENLRATTKRDNALNTGLRSTNKTGYTGVHQIYNGSYESSLTYKGKKLYIGLFKCPTSASIARKKFAKDFGYATDP